MLPIIISDDLIAHQPAGQCDCDCDCTGAMITPTFTFDLSQQPDLLDDQRPFRLVTSTILPLDNNFVVCMSPYHSPAVLNDTALSLTRLFEQPRALPDALCAATQRWGEAVARQALVRLCAARLVAPNDSAVLPQPSYSTTLTAWLHVTDRCNLRCDYCYLPHVRADMSAEIGRAAIDATLRSARIHGHQRMKLKYAGGEALLCFPVVANLHRYAHKQLANQPIALEGVVLSNATLLNRAIVQEMQVLDLRLMISLDGLGQYHDQQRPYAGGRATFSDVARAIDLAQAHGLTPDISVTVTGASARGLAELVSWLLDRDLPFGLNFYRENDLSMSHIELKLEEQHIVDGMLQAFYVIEHALPQRSLLASLVDRANLAAAHTHTCSAGRDYLVFDYRGRVAKCQMHLHQSITTASVADPLGFIRNDTIGLQNLAADEKEGCRSCEWKHWCTGGCALATFRATGRYDIQSPNCSIYQALYPEAVRLEGMRLLKYYSLNMAMSV
jgi:uncharacterized protein